MSALLDITDHIGKTKDLTEALLMATESVGSEEGSALMALCSIILDRLEEAKLMVEGVRNAEPTS